MLGVGRGAGGGLGVGRGAGGGGQGCPDSARFATTGADTTCMLEQIIAPRIQGFWNISCSSHWSCALSTILVSGVNLGYGWAVFSLSLPMVKNEETRSVHGAG